MAEGGWRGGRGVERRDVVWQWRKAVGVGCGGKGGPDWVERAADRRGGGKAREDWGGDRGSGGAGRGVGFTKCGTTAIGDCAARRVRSDYGARGGACVAGGIAWGADSRLGIAD